MLPSYGTFSSSSGAGASSGGKTGSTQLPHTSGDFQPSFYFIKIFILGDFFQLSQDMASSSYAWDDKR